MTRRLLATYLGLTLVILASLEVPLAVGYRERLDSELTSDLVRDGFAIAGLAEETVEKKASADLDDVARRYADRTGARVVIVDAAGQALADSQPTGSGDFSSRPEIAAALAGEVATGTRRSDTLDTDLLYAAVPIASNGDVHGAVRITYSTDQIDARFRGYVMTLLGVALVCITAAVVLGVLFARWVARPLHRLEADAAALGAGELDRRTPADEGPVEVRQLASAFNSMATELDELVQAQQSFVADASHQLRSPLAALRLRLEIVQSEVADLPDPDGTTRADVVTDLDAALGETARLSRIVDGLLALARADRRPSGEPTAASIEIDAVLRGRADAWQAYAAERSVALTVEPAVGGVLADEDRLTQALDNLVANAIEATAGRPEAEVVLRGAIADEQGPRDATAELHVVDNGPGLDAEQRARAFDRFWRAGPTSAPAPDPAETAGGDGRRTSPVSGSGLGLAIARQLVRADHGDLALEPAPSGGLDAIVRLPAAP